MKRKLIEGFICILMVVFICMPFPSSRLTIRLYLDQFEGEDMALFYTTAENPSLGSEQCCTARIDQEKKQVVFHVPAEAASQLVLLRVDFPETEQMLSIQNVAVGSAGIIRRNYSPCDFFVESNIASQNDIAQISLIPSSQIAYFKISGNDPYLVFRPGVTEELMRHVSSYRLSRFALCLILVAGYILYRVKPFDDIL